MAAFAKDVEGNDGAYRFERDAEIRYLYWFLAATLAEKKNDDSTDDRKTVILKSQLKKWRDLHTNTKPKPQTHLNLYAPPGLDIDGILSRI